MTTAIPEFEKIPPEIRKKMGAWKTLNGECPLGCINPMACMFCSFGHMVECHHPLECDEAECSHYQVAREAEEVPYHGDEGESQL